MGKAFKSISKEKQKEVIKWNSEFCGTSKNLKMERTNPPNARFADSMSAPRCSKSMEHSAQLPQGVTGTAINIAGYRKHYPWESLSLERK